MKRIKLDEAEMRTVSLVYRGRVLEKTAIMEKVIEYFCLKFLCKPHRERDAILFLFGDNRMSLEQKKQVFIGISTAHFKSWLDEFAPTKKDRSLSGEISKLAEERNKFAHLIIDQTEDGKKLFEESRIVTFTRFKDDVLPFRFGNKEMDELDARFVKVVMYIQNGTKTLNMK
jgi:hypothetical protein